MSNTENNNTERSLDDRQLAEIANRIISDEINKKIREGNLETVSVEGPANAQNPPCVFCGTTNPDMHVKFCGICKKWMCDTCRRKYGERMRAAANEHFPAVTQTAEAIKERAKKLFALRQQQRVSPS